MLKKRLKPILATLGILLTVTSATEVSALTAAEFKATKLPYSVMAYSNQYAHEYGLDAGKAVELSKGLEAIKLILYKKHYPEGGMVAFDVYKCSAELYVDKGLDIWWPRDELKASSVRTGETGLKAFFASDLLIKYGERIGPERYAAIRYTGFDRTKSPIFDQIMLDTGCTSYPRTPISFSLWLEKKGNIDYSAQSVAYVPTPNDFYQFRLPKALLNSFIPYTNKVS
ncbi:hypothetical protein AVI50_04690 [Piscirickettsia salmonis]|uniref:hypothetical protein n=1 Tax=Piscirickettsia salmonis TaxID=1238 RepID=UPI00094A7260|nr:hypothetical protein [Piscirickettsia salmonis]APS50211.1 hypothetical protein AVI50_04690 [Piscirickettsia salmonis]QHS31858.1 hypothetical protein GW535_04320 [Piscirickettsia salmonis]